MKHAPRDLLQSIAVAVSVLTNPTIPTGGPENLRAVVDRAPGEWRDDGFHYVTVTQVSASAPALRGDGATIVDSALVQVSLWERRDREDPARLQAIIDALDGTILTGQSYAGTEVGTIRLAGLETDIIQHAITYRYPLAR
jgi:hypothetical protein